MSRFAWAVVALYVAATIPDAAVGDPKNQKSEREAYRNCLLGGQTSSKCAGKLSAKDRLLLTIPSFSDTAEVLDSSPDWVWGGLGLSSPTARFGRRWSNM